MHYGANFLLQKEHVDQIVTLLQATFFRLVLSHYILVSSKDVKLHSIVQVHPYTYRNENQFLHFNFHQDPYTEYDFWINTVGVDGLFTDFTRTLHRYQELTSPHPKDETANSLLVKISQMISAYEGL
jgi:hypothetical protein